jgi:hypothetical protein
MSETDQQTALDGIPSSLDDMASGDTPLSDVFPEEFVQKYTEAASIDALLDQRSWSASTFGDLDSIPLAELDDLVDDQSQFGSWVEMAQAAGDEFAHRSGAY